jgi:hypothetical protein
MPRRYGLISPATWCHARPAPDAAGGASPPTAGRLADERSLVARHRPDAGCHPIRRRGSAREEHRAAAHTPPLVPAAQLQAADDERWYLLPLSERIREDHARVVKEAGKRGRRPRVGSATLGATSRSRDPVLDAALRARADNIYPDRGGQ